MTTERAEMPEPFTHRGNVVITLRKYSDSEAMYLDVRDDLLDEVMVPALKDWLDSVVDYMKAKQG